jgi:asparagine synthase (glutamine-hydrolysing)
MCGIAGKVCQDGPVAPGLVERMCDRIEHRGPDSRGMHRSPGAELGIQRLSVIDLETGDQPIYNEDRSVAVVLNGEIYNYRELRQELAERGHVLTTRSDTEVIAHLY